MCAPDHVINICNYFGPFLPYIQIPPHDIDIMVDAVSSSKSSRKILSDELTESFVEYLVIHDDVNVNSSSRNNSSNNAVGPLPENVMRSLQDELIMFKPGNRKSSDKGQGEGGGGHGDDELIRWGVQRTVARVLDRLQSSPSSLSDPGFLFSQSELVVLELIVNMYETREDWEVAEKQFSQEYVRYFKQILWTSQKVLALCDVWESFEGGQTSSSFGGFGGGSGSNTNTGSGGNSGFCRFLLFIADGIGSGQKRNTKTLYTPIGDLMKYAYRKDQDSAKINNGKSFGLVSAIQSTVMCCMKVLHSVIKYNKKTDSKSLESKTVKKGIQDVEDAIKIVYDEFKNSLFQPTSLQESVSGPDEKMFAEQFLERLYYILRFVVTFKVGL